MLTILVLTSFEIWLLDSSRNTSRQKYKLRSLIRDRHMN